MNEVVLPSFPVLTMSSGLAVAPRWFFVATFIVNDGEAGLWALLQSRRSAAVATAVVEVVVGATACVVWVVVVLVTATGGSVPEGYVMAMISSASCIAAAAILSASAGLEIIWFIGFMVGVGYVWNCACCL